MASRGLGRVERDVLAALRDSDDGLLLDDLQHVASERSLRRALASLQRKGLVIGERLDVRGRPVLWRSVGASGHNGGTRARK